MPHRDSIVDADRVELEGNTAAGANRILHEAADFLEVNVSRNDVDVRVADGDHRLVPVLGTTDLTGRPQQAAMGRAMSAARDGVRSHIGLRAPQNEESPSE